MEGPIHFRYDKETLHLNWVIIDIFMKIKLKGTNPSKFNVKGTLYLNWVLKGPNPENSILKGHT